MQFELLIEFGNARLELFNEPSGKRFRFRNCQLAEFRAGAGDGAAPEGCRFNLQIDMLQLPREFRSAAPRHIDENEVLHRGCGQFARAEAFGELGGLGKLISRDASAENRRADIGEPRLLLRMNSNVVAIDIGRNLLILSSLELVAQSPLKLATEPFFTPPLLKKQVLEPCTFPVLAQC